MPATNLSAENEVLILHCQTQFLIVGVRSISQLVIVSEF
jgi:hypothetical protein